MVHIASKNNKAHHDLEIIETEGEQFFRIDNMESMRPFLMTIVSPDDHWMFIASNGGLTAGRKNPEFSLFPYDTDDKVIESAVHTGNKTLVRWRNNEKTCLWEPFAEYGIELFNISRSIYKNAAGNKVIFEEINHEVGLSFRYMWTFGRRFGFIKHATLTAHEACSHRVEVIDGVMNLMPSGVPSQLQIQRSTLVDAYKRNECDLQSGLGMFSLSAVIVDKAEPSEALLTTTAWCRGTEVHQFLLSKKQIAAFRQGNGIHSETDVVGEKGSFLCLFHLDLMKQSSYSWYQVFEVNQSHSDVANLRTILLEEPSLERLLDDDINRSTEALMKLVACSDGLQKTADDLSVARHYTNVLFNIMRGGLFDEHYHIPTDDYRQHLLRANKGVYHRSRELLKTIGSDLTLHELSSILKKTDDADLLRLSMEYLPLFFSRRHGDPSRPWNYFSIHTTGSNGEKIRNYEGNWRDIFQNWEALSYSYPEFTEGFIFRFLNASTIDGYNPYRVSKDGIDWEIEEADDPWSYIGYWGDHQVVYLLKLLELSVRFHPNMLLQWMDTPVFVYANVPYRIKNYHDLLLDPRNTIDFDHGLEDLILKRVDQTGFDGKLVWDEDGQILRASLAEKLLVSLTAKLSNFVPRAGIWLNTQRPEWNDANNALVGNGISMVTLCYLRRYINFLFQFFRDSGLTKLHFNRPVAQMIESLERTFSAHIGLLAEYMSDQQRRSMLDDLGAIGEQYRTLAYSGFNGRIDPVSVDKILSLLELSLRFCDDAIRHNKRKDGLYHAYNLLELSNGKAAVRHLYEMLEGQVAVLSTGLLSPEESLSLLDSLKKSDMYREDQYSYMLYPNRRLKGFLEKNTIPDDLAETCPLFAKLVLAGDHSLVEQDVKGSFHFSKEIHNEMDIRNTLAVLVSKGWEQEVESCGTKAIEIFETLFDHSAFTGRSGTFYGYEGLGSIYWHMVSKLLLAVQESIHWAVEKGVSHETFGRLVEHYYEIRAGIGVNKSPRLYGAFPTDAYSHTPINEGAQQPGMTGQVKEDVINRWAELGLNVHDGCLSFRPRILRKSEFLESKTLFEYVDVFHKRKQLELPERSLAFTICQVPVIYHLSESERLLLITSKGEVIVMPDSEIDAGYTAEIFRRNGKVARIEVHCSPHI